MLSVMGKSTELGVHVRGAIRNGVTEIELSETLLQVAGYGGFATGMEGRFSQFCLICGVVLWLQVQNVMIVTPRP